MLLIRKYGRQKGYPDAPRTVYDAGVVVKPVRLLARDGLSARKAALDERLARLATDERLWPTAARLRTFRGIDTLTALCLHLELGGDWRRFRSPRRLDEVGPAREAEVLMRLGGRVLLSPLTLWPWRSIFRG